MQAILLGYTSLRSAGLRAAADAACPWNRLSGDRPRGCGRDGTEGAPGA